MIRFATFVLDKNINKHDEIAIVDCNGTRNTTWDSFRDQVFKVHQYVVEQGLKGVVPVYMERSAEAIVTIFGLNLAGVGISPVSLSTPSERCDNICEQLGNKLWTIEDYSRAMQVSLREYNANDDDTSNETACIIFTSGSTGNPKGVMLSDRALIDVTIRLSGPGLYDLHEGDRLLQMSSFSFIAYLQDCFSALYTGSQIHFLPEESRGDVGKIEEYIERNGITQLFMAPQLYRNCEFGPSIKTVCIGSDKVVNIAPKGHRLVNGYGMSETAGIVYAYEIKEAMKETPVGKPLHGVKEYILGEDGKLCDEGELCLSGSITHGYFNLPELNDKVFSTNPFCNEEGHETLYHTGDLVRKLPDGNLLFIDRIDNMIKINGQRIEPSEIEICMMNYDGIEIAVVKGFKDDEWRGILCAYYTCTKDIDENDLTAYIASKLPRYMVPAFFVKMDEFPVNANGKINRKALEMPDVSAFKNEYEAPRNTIEEMICVGFEKALNIDKIGAKDDFFRMGGDSIGALIVVKECENIGVSTTDVLTGRTPRGIATIVENKGVDLYKNLAENDCAPLTDSQMGVYLECMLDTASTMYNIPAHIEIEKSDDLNIDFVKERIDAVIKKHPALYSHLEKKDDTVYMVRSDFPDGGIAEVIDVMPDLKCYAKPFDLDNGPLVRAEIYSGDNINILLDMHHVVSDGTSLSLIVKQIKESLEGKEPAEETIDAFSLYEIEERQHNSKAYELACDYYNNLLSGVETDSNIVADNKPAQDGSHPCNVMHVKLDIEGLREGLLKTDITDNSLFMAAYGYTLAKMTAQEDSLFTVGENGRSTSLLDNTVSMLVRTLPVVMHIDESNTLKETARAVQNQLFTSMSHDSISFGELCRKYGINSDVSFVYQSDMFDGCEILEVNEAMNNLDVMVFKAADGYTMRIIYRCDKYNETSIKRLADLYMKSLESFVDDIPLKDINLISEEDKKLIESFNDTEAKGYDEITIIDRFRTIVAEYPDRTALVYKENKYTFNELDDITDRLAAYIHSLGIGREQVVSVLIPRSDYMLICAIGIMKAGAIYEPMDPTYPKDRLHLMYTDADAKLIIFDRDMRALIPDYNGKILYTDEIINLPEPKAEVLEACKPAPEDTYVLLYTSGTTGTPKGVMLSHKNLISFAYAHSVQLGIDINSKMASYASYGFDAHMADLYPAISTGSELHIVADEIRFDFPALKSYFESNGITHALMTTQVARQFILEYDYVEGMQCISMGGESLTAIAPPKNYRVLNLYGPSETTICVSGFVLDKYYENVPIGKPMLNCTLDVVDKYGRQLPIGVPGELIIGGAQVGKGYLNRPQKTAEAFVGDIYKSGDIVRFLDSGDIEFIGRRDLQVKIRGFRIELSEVEQVIREYPGISDATAIVVEGKGGKSIHAYFVAKETVDIADLNRFIKERKPSYMVPAASMQIEAMPLTPNHKIDKRKLPPIVIETSETDGSGSKVFNCLEEELMAILTDIVGEGGYGIGTSFSDAGITSITSIKLSSQIYKKYGVNISSKDLLDGGSILTVENEIIKSLTAGKSDNAENTTDKAEKKMLDQYPLTQTQMGIYLDCLRAGMDAYNIPFMFKLPDDTDIDRYKDAVITAVKAHPSMLCYIYADEDGDISIYPQLDMDVVIHEETVDSVPPEETHFEFGEQPLFNIRLIECNGDKYLFIEAHHIISDGESMTILVQDIDTVYTGGELVGEKYTAYDYAIDEQASRKGNILTKAKEYYDSVFKGVSSDYLPVPDKRDDTVKGELSHTLEYSIADIKKFCADNNITENVFFTSVFAMTIAKYSSHEDALFTTIYNGRNDPRTERLVSMLVKTLPIYIEAEPEASVKEFLANLENRLKLIKKHDVFSFADAAKEYGVTADAMFIYQGKMNQSAELDGKALEVVDLGADGLKAELSLEVFDEDKAYRCWFEYNAGHYTDKWIQGFADAYQTCLASLIKADKLGDIDICSEKAFNEFADFNDTYVEVNYRPAYRMIEEQAQKHPDKLAVVASPEDSSKLLDSEGNHIYEKLTYRQFDHMTNNLAKRIIDAGIKRQSPVAVMTYRSKEIYIGQIGIIKAGCPFVFISPAYPDERVSFIREDANIQAIVTTHALAEEKKELLAELNIPVIFADDIDVNCIDESLNIEFNDDDVVYMIYTSGTTGKPKGVIVLNKGLVNIADDNPLNTQLQYFLSDIGLAVLAFTFDASLLDGFCALANGMTVCIATDEEIHNPSEFVRLALDTNAQSFIGTPSFLMSLLDVPNAEQLIRQTKAMICGGESFPPALFEKLYSLNPDIRIANAYGPSECTVACTAQPVTSAENITIGAPLNNYKIYIIDKQKHILPMGALGELAILGIGVGGGYLNRDELTAKTFIEINGERAYRSGDLALITHSEDVEFHGRIDNQVKLRGLRIELGEIENQINACPDVKNSVAVVKGKGVNQYLAAYFIAEREIDPAEITERISKSLAEYMVPRIIIQLDEMPMTAHGKINRKALPEPVLEMAEREYVAPSNDVEEKLCDAFANALELDRVGVTEDFFELGGSSLTATKVAMYAMSHNINIVYKDIFENPTVKELAALAGVSDVPTAENLEEDRKVDYSKAEQALEGNTGEITEPVGNRPIGDVLLTGATGFLGMHIFKELLDKEEGNIYCLIREGKFSSVEKKLSSMYMYYFGDTIKEQIGKRVHCIKGDITDADTISKLKNIKFDTLFNCAACVKHFASDDILHKSNVVGVTNLIELCKSNNARLIHVSTTSVAGEGVNDEPPRDRLMKENELYIGQIMDNQYIATKFMAEKAILEAIVDGLDAKIMRAGNLMPRYSDGEFQINQLTNGFMKYSKGYIALGCIPISDLAHVTEFSPIDETASMMVSLARTESRFTVFHANNIHKVYFSDVVRCMHAAGLKLEPVPDPVYKARLHEKIDKEPDNTAVSGLIAYDARDSRGERYIIHNDNIFTAEVLNRLGCYWNITDDDYMINAFKKLDEMGYYDL